MDNPHRITEPREMRALAHPLRLRLLGLLRVEGPATATGLADTVGESPALVSYHLRQLDAYNFVEEAPELASDGRERWWRAAQASTQWDAADFLDTPERLAALTSLQREVFRRYRPRSRHLCRRAHVGSRVGRRVGAQRLFPHARHGRAQGAHCRARRGDRALRGRTAAGHVGPVENVAVILHTFPADGRAMSTANVVT